MSGRRHNAAIQVMLYASAGIAAIGVLGAQDASFRTSVNLVLLDVGVTNSQGVPVKGLGPEQFQIWENNRKQEIARFDQGAASLSLALVFDYSGSMRPHRRAIAAAAESLLSRLKPEDEAALVTFSDHPHLVAGLLPVAEAAPTWPKMLQTRAPEGRTSLYDAVMLASRQLESSRYERRVIILVSDGEDTASTTTREQLADALRSSNRLLYCVGLFEPGEPDTNFRVLRSMAESTGGVALFEKDPERLGDEFAQIVADLRSRYVLTFKSPEAAPGQVELRHVKVTATDSAGHRLHVRYRREYKISGLR